MVPIPLPATGRLTKFQRPAFGNGRVYVIQQNVVIAIGSSGTNPPPPTTTTTTTSSSTSSSTTSTTSSTTSTTTSTTPSTTSTSTTLSTSTTSTTPTPTASGYPYIGCFADKSSGGRALPLLFSNNSVTPELCIAYAQSLAKMPTPTVLPYVYVEYHRECYGGSSFAFGTSGVTSLTGAHACTDVCSGSIGAATTGTASCGGRGQFNLYATRGTVSWPSQPTTQSV